MPVDSFQDVKALINGILSANGQAGDVPNSPHKDFWNSLSYNDFITGNVPHVPNNGQALRILVPGDSGSSALVQVLRGVGIADPVNGTQDRMPANGPPWFTDQQIQELADWIDNGCPQ